VGWLSVRRCVRDGLVGEGLEMVFQRLVAFRDPLEVRVVHRHFLLEDKQEVRLPGAFETPSDLVPRGMNARVTQGGKRLRVTFAREDRADNALSGPPAQVTDDIGELDVRLGQHFLRAWMHVLTACT
jgi:hypothetical protein